MAQPIHSVSVEEFEWLLGRFPFTRNISAIHLDHTQGPDLTSYRGRESIEDLYRLHTEGYGFRSFAQHVTIAPDGKIWIGRNWNLPPASAPGHNGNESDGPFLIALVGNFDFGYDELVDSQRSNSVKAMALIEQRFDLPLEALRFQRDLVDDISGPGSSVEYDELIKALRKERTRLRKRGTAGAATELGEGREQELSQLITELSGDQPANRENTDSELRAGRTNGIDFIDFSRSATPIGGGSSRSGSRDLNTGIIEAVRPHVINLRLGQFSDDGEISTVPSDVDAIFEEHLERALAGQKAQGKKLHILFYAHGGLVAEKNALLQAHTYTRHWRKNGIYPIYFVWETGLKETLSQLLFGAGRQLERSGARARPTDWFVEVLARRLGGPLVWSGIKTSARLASEAEGGARYVAQKLVEFVEAHPDEVEIHAAGHSAGSIFQNHFLPAAFELGLKKVKSLHLLAPAVTVEDFEAGLAPHLGKEVEHTTVFTLKRAFELADDSAKVYHKSLLYLLYYALEARKRTPILGLEIALRKDRDLKRLFGLGRSASEIGEVVWSPSGDVKSGRSATQARLHGDFDNDSATLNSMVRRILGVDDDDTIKAIPALGGGRSGEWSEEIEWPSDLAEFFRPQPAPGPSPAPQPAPQPNGGGTVPIMKPVPSPGGGRRRALCIGIDDYAEAPLAGCVADARLWSETLTSLGFETPRLLTNGEATRDAILVALNDLIEASQAGDVVVFQFAGHGIFLPDLSGDEADGDTAEHDEALCPIDYSAGAYVIDDDIAEIFARIPEGVNVTCFMDCCHSGTVSRLGIGLGPGQRGNDGDRRARYLKTTKAHVEAHETFRNRIGGQRSLTPRGPESMREVLFSACRSDEVAWESNGHGEFTLTATAILTEGAFRLSHEDFERKVINAFGETPRQHPQLDCAPALRRTPLLQPVAAETVDVPAAQPVPPAQTPDIAQFIGQLQSILAQWSKSNPA